jgi:hypothetical protein
VVLNYLIITNFGTFRKITKIFVNFYAFGHSVTDTCIFFTAYGSGSVCISVGNKNERNWQLKQILKINKIIHFRLPLFKLKNDIIYRKLFGPEIIYQINRNYLLKKINKNISPCLNFDETIRKSTIINLSKNSDLNFKVDEQIILKLEALYKENGNSNGAATQISWQNRCLVEYNLPKKLLNFESVYIKKINDIKKQKSRKICTLILRNKNQHKPHAGLGLSGYKQILEFLVQNGYFVNLVGDLDYKEYVLFKNHWTLQSRQVISHFDLNVSEKIFQIISIKNSEFCLGDPSGLQALVWFFGTRNLIFNNVPTVNMNYNTLILPRIWRKSDGNLASMNLHFNELLYRIYPWKDEKDTLYSPTFNSPETMMETLSEFLILLESGAQIQTKPMVKNLLSNSPVLSLSQNSDISSAFLKLLA